MSLIREKRAKRLRRHKKIRARIFGTSDRPRLSVFRSNKHIWVKLIDDSTGFVLVSASDLEVETKKSSSKRVSKKEFSKKLGTGDVAGVKLDNKLGVGGKVGKLIARKALDKKIKNIVFDRGGYRYHGVIKAVAGGAREEGLQF